MIKKDYVIGLDLGQVNDATALILLDCLPMVRVRGNPIPTELLDNHFSGNNDFVVVKNVADATMKEAVLRKDVETAEPVFNAVHIERLPQDVRYTKIIKYVCDFVTKARAPKAFSMVAGKPFYVDQDSRPFVTLVVDYTGAGIPIVDMLVEAAPDCDIIPVTITGGNNVTRDDMGYHVPKRHLASVVQRMLQEGRVRIPSSVGAPLVKELTGFRVKISLKGVDTYGAGEDWRSAEHDDLVLALAMGLWYGDSRAPVGVY